MNDKQKVLFCGDVEGKFHTLFGKIEKINKKSGPFDLLLCVGNFFGINNREFEPYVTGLKKVAVPTYILGPNNDHQAGLYRTDYEICPNVYYLGKRGLFTTSGGIKIAYMSGIGDVGANGETRFSEKDITELYNMCLKGNPHFRGIDILLTSQWPMNIIRNQAEKRINSSSDLVSWLSMKLRPRYHVSALEGVFYERAPFRYPNLGGHDSSMEIVTRFLGLARVGNPENQKWLYALSLTPLEKMKIVDLLQKTTDETECPFDFNEIDSRIFNTKRKSSSGPGINQYFYDATPVEEDTKKKKHKKQKVEFDQSKCWFCLASPSVEKSLIITVGTHTYLALAKGGLVEEHFLICPIQHFQSFVALPEEVVDELGQFKKALQKFYAREEKLAVFFERNYKTSHMQLQVVPIPKQAIRELKEIFIEEAEDQGFKLEELETHNRLDQVVPTGVPYFTVELPDGTFLYTKIQGAVNFPLNFGREVLAAGAILNIPERTDWKECILMKEDEETLVQRIRTDFEPFDFTID